MTYYNPYSDPVVPYCILGSSPICSKNNNTFINKCVMHLLGEEFKRDGWCDEEQKKIKLINKKDRKTKINGYLKNGEINKEDPNCPKCNKFYNPVCGVNGVTYTNLCKLQECARVEKLIEGPCGFANYKMPEKPELCHCPFKFKPACSQNGITFQDKCVLKCSGFNFRNEGPCERKCGCTSIFKPTCGMDGKTYKNQCEMECENINIDYEGQCDLRKKCDDCENKINFVCGTNGDTYDNLCFLECSGNELYSNKKCETKNAICDCHKKYLPVCGEDNKNYKNECLAKCVNINKKYNGLCKTDYKMGNVSMENFNVKNLLKDKNKFLLYYNKIFPKGEVVFPQYRKYFPIFKKLLKIHKIDL